MPTAHGSTAFLTDHYELTMLAAALRDGTAGRRSVFEVFARKLPAGRRYGVVGGLGRLLDAIGRFRFADDQLDHLRDDAVVDERTIEWLADFAFTGDVAAYPEGELYFPYSPVLTVEATFAEAVVLETLVLSILNHDSAVASAAARMVDAAAGRFLLDMGTRRTHEEAGVAAARVAHLVGFGGTSNLEAGLRHGVPTRGTSAHAFTLAHDDEEAAFASQLDALGVGTTLLVDTFDIPTAIRIAVRLANERGATGPGAVRIDSGDLAVEAAAARDLLDSLGATDTKIVVSGDLDEYLIEDLVERCAPIDSFGVGTRLVGGSGHPTAGFVYKLVAIETDDPDAPLRPVAKRSANKISVGGRKLVRRHFDDDGFAAAERFTVVDTPLTAHLDRRRDDGGSRLVQVTAIRDGERVLHESADDVRRRHRSTMTELRPQQREVIAGEPAFTVTQEEPA